MEEPDEAERHDKTNYSSTIAQTVEAGGNFVNNISNPWFVLALILIIGGGYILYKSTYIISGSLDNIATKMDSLSGAINDQKVQMSQEIDILNQIADRLKKGNHSDN